MSTRIFTRSTFAGREVTAQDVAILFLRVSLAVVFIAHGGQKMFGWWGGPGAADFVSGMATMGIPAPLAYAAMVAEFFGGLALLVGLFTRLAALGIAVTMAVAMFKVHFANGFFLANEGGGFEFTFVLLLVALAVALLGPGRLALGDFEVRNRRK